MEHSNTISGLQRKRNDLCREIEQYQASMDRARAELDAIDGALSVFGCSPARPPRPTECRFKRGQVLRMICDTLRTRTATTAQLVEKAIEIGGIDKDSMKARKSVSKAVDSALRTLQGQGRVERVRRLSKGSVWGMVPR